MQLVIKILQLYYDVYKIQIKKKRVKVKVKAQIIC